MSAWPTCSTAPGVEHTGYRGSFSLATFGCLAVKALTREPYGRNVSLECPNSVATGGRGSCQAARGPSSVRLIPPSIVPAQVDIGHETTAGVWAVTVQPSRGVAQAAVATHVTPSCAANDSVHAAGA